MGESVSKQRMVVADWMSLAVAIATLSVAITNYFMFRSLDHQQNILETQLKITASPTIIAEIDDPLGLGPFQLRNLTHAGQKDEKWTFFYFLSNTGTRNAYDLEIYKQEGTEAVFEMPDSANIQRKPDKLIFPGMKQAVGSGEIYRAEVLEIQKKGENYYRHLYYAYRDESGNRYAFKVSWQLDHYEVGDKITWSAVDFRRMP